MNFYVASLGYRVNSETPGRIFAKYGAGMSAEVITDKFSECSRDFEFVEISDEAVANKTIEKLNSSEYDGKEITVSIAGAKTECSNQRRDIGNTDYRGNSRRY